jgi:hypothetical protein
VRSELVEGWLQDKRLRFVAQWLPSVLGLVSTFVGLANQVGYPVATLIAIVVALVLWIISNQVIKKVSPQSSVTSIPARKPQATASAASQTVCGPGPYKVDAGGVRSIPLSIKQGQRLRGHLEEVDGQPFGYYIADEKNMILLKQGEYRKFKPVEGNHDNSAYRVNRKIPWQGRWYLILDMYGKQYDREIRVDFEPVVG